MENMDAKERREGAMLRALLRIELLNDVRQGRAPEEAANALARAMNIAMYDLDATEEELVPLVAPIMEELRKALGERKVVVPFHGCHQ